MVVRSSVIVLSAVIGHPTSVIGNGAQDYLERFLYRVSGAQATELEAEGPRGCPGVHPKPREGVKTGDIPLDNRGEIVVLNTRIYKHTTDPGM